MNDYWKKLFSMQNDNIFGLILLLLFIVFVIWKITSSTKENEKLTQKLQAEYEQITIETVIDNDLRKTYYHPEWRGSEFSQYITLDDGRKLALKIDDCISHDEIYLDDIFPKSVLLIKNRGSDTLKIVDHKNEYLFKLKLID